MKKQTFSDLFFLIASILLFLLLVYRAFTLDITHDEAYSFYLATTVNINQMATTANNHWLNTISIWVFTNLFQSYEVGIVRLQSIFAFIFYAWAIFRFQAVSEKLLWKALIFFTFLCNPFVLDFFSLARGYALSMSFQMCGFFFIFQALQNMNRKRLLLAFCSFTLATAANYTTFYIFLLLSVQYFLLFLLPGKKYKTLTSIPSTVLIILTSLVSMANLFLIRYYGDLEFGEHNSFIRDSLGSLISNSTFDNINTTVSFLLAFILFLFIIGISGWITLSWLMGKRSFDWITFLALTTSGVILLIEGLHLLFNTPYLIERTTLALFPLLGLTCCFYLKFLAAHILPAWRVPVMVASISLFAALLLNTIFHFDTRYFLSWKMNADSKDKLHLIAQDVKKENKQNNKTKVYLGWVKGVYFNYYSFMYPEHYSFIPLINQDNNIVAEPKELVQILTKADYAILEIREAQNELQKVNRPYDILERYPITKTVVVKFLDQ